AGGGRGRRATRHACVARRRLGSIWVRGVRRHSEGTGPVGPSPSGPSPRARAVVSRDSFNHGGFGSEEGGVLESRGGWPRATTGLRHLRRVPALPPAVPALSGAVGPGGRRRGRRRRGSAGGIG